MSTVALTQIPTVRIKGNREIPTPQTPLVAIQRQNAADRGHDRLRVAGLAGVDCAGAEGACIDGASKRRSLL